MSSALLAIRDLRGYVPDLPTPFDHANQVDVESLEALCEQQIRQGANALVICNTIGEATSLSDEERMLVIRTAVEAARSRIPVIAGAGSNSTAHAIALSKAAEAAGADALLSVVPYYNRPTQAGLCAHFEAIMASSGLPLIIHDIPSRTACSLGDGALARIAEQKNCFGLLDGTGDQLRGRRLRKTIGPRFKLLSGDDSSAHEFLLNGGDACISATCNVAPNRCHQLFSAATTGDTETVRRLVAILDPLNSLLSTESAPSAVKYALSLPCLVSPRVRLPLLELSETTRRDLDAVLRTIGEGYEATLCARRPAFGANASSRRGEIARDLLSRFMS
jgi:4-hydroxy-tetrahydrodipicolinate synthase